MLKLDRYLIRRAASAYFLFEVLECLRLFRLGLGSFLCLAASAKAWLSLAASAKSLAVSAKSLAVSAKSLAVSANFVFSCFR